MLEEHLPEIGITKKDFFTSLFLLFNVFTWYYMTLALVDRFLSDQNVGSTPLVIYYVAAFGSSIVGAVLSSKITRFKLLSFWTIFGAVTSLFPLLLDIRVIMNALVICFLLGFSIGLGMPSCLAYFADHTDTENRGSVGGVIFLAANVGFIPLTISLSAFNLMINSVVCAVWRGLGLVVLFFLKPQENTFKTNRQVSFISILQNRPFILYFIAWSMFFFTDRFETAIFRQAFESDFILFMRMIEPVFASISALVGGLLSDVIGRKKVVIYGFIALGFAYAVMSIAPTISASWYFYCIIDGTAAGILWVLFVLVLWGDLSKVGTREKYYAIGSTTFFLGGVIPLVLTPSVELIPPYAAFSLASFFLFVAVLPLMYAPETLPERKIELRQVRKYVEAAKKVKEKYKEKGAKD